MTEKMRRVKPTLTFSIALILIFAAMPFASAQPQLPMTIYGTVLIDGQPASEGVNVYAKVDATVVAQDTTDTEGQYILVIYVEDVPEGTQVDLYVEDTFVQSVTMESGDVIILDLAVAAPADTAPPTVSNVQVTPQTGTVGTEFTITAQVADPSGVHIVEAQLYREGVEVGGWETMEDDGAHGDGAAGDGVYGYIWNSAGASTGTYTVAIFTSDTVGNSQTYPDVATFTVAVEVAPTVDFTGTPRTGTPPLTVQFTDLSAGFETVTSRLWSFGDGVSSSEQNPSHTYIEEGSYTVSLTVTGTYMGESVSLTETKTGYIQVTTTMPTRPGETTPAMDIAREKAEAILAGTGEDYNRDGTVDVKDGFEILLDNNLITEPAYTIQADIAGNLLATLQSIYGENLEQYPSVEGRIWLLYILGQQQ